MEMTEIGALGVITIKYCPERLKIVFRPQGCIFFHKSYYIPTT